MRAFIYLLSKEQYVQVCDATGDAIFVAAGCIIIY